MAGCSVLAASVVSVVLVAPVSVVPVSVVPVVPVVPGLELSTNLREVSRATEASPCSERLLVLSQFRIYKDIAYARVSRLEIGTFARKDHE